MTSFQQYSVNAQSASFYRLFSAKSWFFDELRRAIVARKETAI